MPLLVVHRNAGYEAWKDETKFRGANWRFIFAVLAVVFMLGCAGSTGIYFAVIPRFAPPSELSALPTLAVIPTLTPFPTQNIIVVAQLLPATPTPSPTPEATPNLQATLNFMLQQQQQLKADVTPELQVEVVETIWCDGAPFAAYEHGQNLRVTFEDNGALRLLDKPRTLTDSPNVQKQLYDGDIVTIEGEPVCGRWQGAAVAYYPVYVERWRISGYVGYGLEGDVWLEPQN